MNGRCHTEGGNKDSPLHICPSFSHLSIYAGRKPLNRVDVDYVSKRTMACHRGLRTFGKLPPGVFRNRTYAPFSRKSYYAAKFVVSSKSTTSTKPTISPTARFYFQKPVFDLAQKRL